MTADEVERICLHESGHAAAAICKGIQVDRLERFEHKRVDRNASGFINVKLDFSEMDAETARAVALCGLAGAYAEGLPIPPWPLDPNRSQDERLVSAFCARAEIKTPEAYAELVEEMKELSRSRRFRSLHIALSLFLESQPVLTRGSIERAVEIAWGREETKDEEVGWFPQEEWPAQFATMGS